MTLARRMVDQIYESVTGPQDDTMREAIFAGLIAALRVARKHHKPFRRPGAQRVYEDGLDHLIRQLQETDHAAG